MRRAALTLGLALCVIVAAPSHAADRVGSGFLADTSSRGARAAARDSGEHRTFRKTPAPLAQCDWFPVLEAGVARLNVDDEQWENQMLFSNSIGLMRNVSAHDALGASLDVHMTNGFGAWSPTVRWRRFMGARASAELSAGWISNDHDGVRGPIAQVRYAPVPQVYAFAGAAQYRRYVWNTAPGGAATAHLEKDSRAFAGAGCNGVPAAVTTVVEALALAAAFALYMED